MHSFSLKRIKMNYSELLVLVFSLALFALVSTFPSLKGKKKYRLGCRGIGEDFSGWRCIACGEIVHPIILANQRRPKGGQKDKKQSRKYPVSMWKVKECFNMILIH